MKTIKEEAEQIMYDVLAWVEVNRGIRPAWVKENLASLFIQNCVIFKTNKVLGGYHWSWLFCAKNLRYEFDEQCKLKYLRVNEDHPAHQVFLEEFNRGLKQGLEEFKYNSLPSSMNQTLIDRIDRVKLLGHKAPDNIVVIDMRKLDAISFARK